MRNYLISLILGLVLTFTLTATAEDQLRGSVTETWTIDTARQEAFRDIASAINVSQIPKIDPNLIENLQIRAKGGGKVGNRSITVFDTGSYSVTELCSKGSYYYANNGKLNFLEINSSPMHANGTCPPTFPLKGVKYCVGESCRWSNLTQGSLARIIVTPNFGGDYIFNADGSLAAHWLNNQCFNTNGTSCGTRKALSIKN